MSSLTMPDAGGATLAAAVKAMRITLAVGTGDPAWLVVPPDVPQSLTLLAAPIAMVRSFAVDHVVPDDNGTILMPDSTRWSVSLTASKWLHMAFNLGFQDGPDATLRETAVYLNSTFAADVPPGLTYVPWAKVTAPGGILVARRFEAAPRRGTFETIRHIITL